MRNPLSYWSMKARVEREIRANGGLVSTLNNFPCKLCDRHRRVFMTKDGHVERLIPHKESIDPKKRRMCSRRYLNETQYEFIQSIDGAIAHCVSQGRIFHDGRQVESPKEFKKILEGILYPPQPDEDVPCPPDRLQQAIQFALPVYVQLRRMGYKRMDFY